MNHSQYYTYLENHNLPSLEEKLTAAGVCPENHTSMFALENALQALVGPAQALRIEADIFTRFPGDNQRAQQIAALQDAIAEASQNEDVIEAMKTEDAVTVDNGFTQEQEQAVKAQSEQVYGKVRASRAGQPFPRRDLSGLDGLFPNAYSERRELDEARAFFA